jgi:hypothetical protein
MGEQAYNLMVLRAQTYQEEDDTRILIWLKQTGRGSDPVGRLEMMPLTTKCELSSMVGIGEGKRHCYKETTINTASLY